MGGRRQLSRLPPAARRSPHNAKIDYRALGRLSTGNRWQPPIDHGRDTASVRTETSGKRWWIYQRERFPLVAHGILIAAFSSSAVGYSSLRRRRAPARSSLIVAFASSFLFFRSFAFWMSSRTTRKTRSTDPTGPFHGRRDTA